MFPSLAQVAATLLLSTQVSPASAVSVSRRATTCNGHPELCNRSYGNVTFLGAHDSYAVGSDVFSNQDYDVKQQLTDGARLLQVQAHQSSDGIHLCHTNCLLKDGGTAAGYLKEVKSWVDSNPNEVVTILIVNSDKLPPTQWKSLYESTGLDAVSFAPSKKTFAASEWPTLGSMIDSGKRVVTFLDTQADFEQVPYIIDEFSNVWETEFDVIDPTFSCAVNRTAGDPTTQMYLINHFLDHLVSAVGVTAPAPFKEQLNVTNAVSGPGSLGAQVQTCMEANGRPPNFMLVDFYEYGGGSVFQVAADTNGVTYTPSSPIATPILNATAGTTSTPLNAGAFDPLISGRGIAAWAGILSCILMGALTTL